MEPRVFLAFVGIATAVIVIPGPSVLLIVSNSLRFGVRAGLLSVVGISAAMSVQLAVGVAGITSLVFLLADWVEAICWVGIVYLGYLGVVRWRTADTQGASANALGQRGSSSLAQGFLVALTNPTTMTFFVAFFPQFLDMHKSATSQLLTMSLTFWVLAAVIDLAYVLRRRNGADPIEIHVREISARTDS